VLIKFGNISVNNFDNNVCVIVNDVSFKLLKLFESNFTYLKSSGFIILGKLYLNKMFFGNDKQ